MSRFVSGEGFCKSCCSLQAMMTKRPLAVLEDWPSRLECLTPSRCVSISTATYREAQASQSEYWGVVSSVGLEVREVVTHLISLGFLPPLKAGQKRPFRRSATSLGVRLLSGVPNSGGTEGAANGGSIHGVIVTGFSGT